MFDKLPDYLVYQEIVETSKLYMKGVTAIEENWLPVFAPYQCTFSKPLESLKPSYDVKSGRMKCHMTSNYGIELHRFFSLKILYRLEAGRKTHRLLSPGEERVLVP